MKNMTMASLLENNLGIIIAFDNKGVVRLINKIGREDLQFNNDEVMITDIFAVLFDGESSYDEFVNAMNGRLIKTVAYRKNNTCFPIAVRFSKMSFEDIEDINVAAGYNMQNEEDAIKTLKKAEEDMKEALHARDEFVANITHELRTPVNGIKGHMKNLMDTETDSKRKYTMNIIMQCCGNMEKIINNLLDFSKMEAGKFEICEKPFNFRACVQHAMETSSVIANEKGIRFNSFVSDDIPETVIGDELRITQILNNILSNALKFTSVGYVTLEVYKTHQREDKVELTFLVTDTGIGMSEEDKQKLFKSFSQADSSITRKYGGTGLGLYVTKQLVEQMHGNIEVESEKGKGSTFTFSIRVGVEEDEAIDEPVSMSNFSIESLKNHSLGVAAKEETELIYLFGSQENKRELAGSIEKLILCIEMENWQKAEDFAETVKSLCSGAEQEVKSKSFRLLMSVRKEDYEKAIKYSYEIRNYLENMNQNVI